VAAQALAFGATAAWSLGVTEVLARLLAPVTPLRVGAEEEFDGLDLATRGERACEHA
jgi:Amt family ammonium transporter